MSRLVVVVVITTYSLYRVSRLPGRVGGWTVLSVTLGRINDSSFPTDFFYNMSFIILIGVLTRI